MTDIIAELRAATLAAGVYPLANGDTIELTAEMRLSEHLQPNFRRPFLDRPAKQQYANWARRWKPVSVEGKAAKAYSRKWAWHDHGPCGIKLHLKRWVA